MPPSVMVVCAEVEMVSIGQGGDESSPGDGASGEEGDPSGPDPLSEVKLLTVCSTHLRSKC